MILSPAAERAGTRADRAIIFTVASLSVMLTDMTDA